MADLRKFTLDAREKLTTEISEILMQVYGLEPDGRFVPPTKRPALSRVAGAMETRKRLEKLFADEQEAGLTPVEAHKKLVKEVAFTHLNRLVALKLLEARKLIRGAIDRYHDSNGFKFYLAAHDYDLKLFEQGSMPQDDLGEGPSDRAYRNFLLWQFGELAKEVRVLFDPDNLASRLAPRPRVLKEIVELTNVEELKDAWAPQNEETIGWVYQFFIADEKDAAFDRVFKKKKKFQKSDIAAATQVFTPRWIVRFLVQNSLGRLWLSMHPDSGLLSKLDYLVPLPEEPREPTLKPAREIRVLDPATGTMHFGLIAFDLLVEMYREELANAGKPGWPEKASVDKEEAIPAAIIANNLYGIDIDLRAVQLAALALYIRAKSTSRVAALTESNLACADIAIFRGQHLVSIAKEIGLPQGITRDLLQNFCESVSEASMMGSLVRLEEHFHNIEAERLHKVIDDFVIAKAKRGADESYFGDETNKGLRLLDVLTKRYDVVFTNPPYMSNRNMNTEMSAFMRKHYKKSKGDLYSGFIERCTELLADEGRLAMITQQSFMFISSFEDLRGALLNATVIEAMAHTGPRAFTEVQGEKVNTTAFILRRENFQAARQGSQGVYFRLVKEPDAEAKRTAFEVSLKHYKSSETDPRLYLYKQMDFAAIPGNPWVYWISPSIRNLFINLPQLRDIAQPRVGLQTGENFRFLRYWWEVGIENIGFGFRSTKEAAKTSKKWFPYMKGGGFMRWYGNQEYCVNWQRDGAEIRCLGEESGKVASRPQNTDFYLRRGVTWTDLTGGRFSSRLSPGGFIFDVKGSSAFPDDIPTVLGLLNSSFANYTLNLINPTVSYQVGDIARLPVPREASTRLRDVVARAIESAKANSEEDETTFDFIAPPEWEGGLLKVSDRHEDLDRFERELDDEVFRVYEIGEADRKAIEQELTKLADSPDIDDGSEDESVGLEEELEKTRVLTLEELAEDWVGYAVGIALGRFHSSIEGSLGTGRFSSEIGAKLRQFQHADGLMVLEEGHPDDLATCVIEILRAIHGDSEAEKIVRTAMSGNGSLRESLEAHLLGSFFKKHVKRYLKRPVYWLLQSPECHYSVYLFHGRATDQTLALLQGKRYLGGRIHRLEGEISEAKETEATASGGSKSAWKKKARDLAEELEDLKAFDRHVTTLNNFPIKDAKGHQKTVRWQPELDDGVLLNAAPLHGLAPYWKKADGGLDLRKAWNELENGEYDWSKTALRYWPERVLRACRDNKSFAFAHGLA